MYKIHINDSKIYLIKSDHLELLNPPKSALIFKYNQKTKYLLNFIDKAEKTKEPKEIWIHAKNLIKLKTDFFSLFRVIKAGGGLVLNESGQVLMIFRRGMWDLPKGKKEKGEKRKETAIREVQEETGLQNVSIIHALSDTYHTYKIKGQRVLKLSFWYLMETEELAIKPQVEEDIEIVEWATIKDLMSKKYTPIYTNIKDLIDEYLSSFSSFG